jgi:hypothetical protein
MIQREGIFMQERRSINRVEFIANSVIVDKETLTRYYGQVKNISPLGIAITVDKRIPDLVGRDVIIVAETMIMYAEAVREDKEENGKKTLAFKSRKFTPDVLQYLFTQIGLEDASE